MIEYDVELLTPSGVTVEHYSSKLETDGPWLIVHGATDGTFDLIVPAGSVVSVKPCKGDGRCDGGGE